MDLFHNYVSYTVTVSRFADRLSVFHWAYFMCVTRRVLLGRFNAPLFLIHRFWQLSHLLRIRKTPFLTDAADCKDIRKSFFKQNQSSIYCEIKYRWKINVFTGFLDVRANRKLTTQNRLEWIQTWSSKKKFKQSLESGRNKREAFFYTFPISRIVITDLIFWKSLGVNISQMTGYLASLATSLVRKNIDNLFPTPSDASFISLSSFLFENMNIPFCKEEKTCRMLNWKRYTQMVQQLEKHYAVSHLV